MSADAEANLIRTSGLFDPEFYRRTYAYWLAEEEDPLHHFLETGLAKGYLPSADFDPVLYRVLVPDCRDANPLLHYLASDRRFRSAPLPVLFPKIRAQISLRAESNGANAATVDPDVEINRQYGRHAAAARELTLDAGGRRYALTVPEPEMLLARLRDDRPFALARLSHGLWDALWMLHRAEEALGTDDLTRILPPRQRRALAERLCAALRPAVGTFAPAFIDEVLADIPVHADHPDFFRSVSFKGYPTFDEDVFGGRVLPPPAEVAEIFAAYFRPEEKIYDATEWKRLLIAGELAELPKLCHRRPIVLVASDLYATLGARWQLENFTHVQIPRSLSQWQRWDVLTRSAKAVTAACSGSACPPAVLLQCGSLAPWLMTRLFSTHPRVFYLDLGRALNGWYFDIRDVTVAPWMKIYTRTVIENCGLEPYYAALMGDTYDEWRSSLPS